MFGEMKMNTALKIALIQYSEPAYKVAEQMGIHETTLTKIIRERRVPSVEEKKKLSKILGKPINELFPV